MIAITTPILRTAAMAAMAVALTFGAGFVKPSFAAAATTPAVAAGKPMCDATAVTRQLYVQAPQVKAFNTTAATDKNTIRYWTRLFDATTGAILTDWFLGGVASATDTTAAPFSRSGMIYGQPWSVRYPIANGTPNVRVQYYVAWYKTDGTLIGTATPYVATYRLALLNSVYIYGSGTQITTAFTDAQSC